MKVAIKLTQVKNPSSFLIYAIYLCMSTANASDVNFDLVDGLPSNVSFTDSSRSSTITNISSDTFFSERTGFDGVSFDYRIAAQVSTDSSLFSTPDEIGLTGFVDINYELPTTDSFSNALWDIQVDINYAGVTYMDGSGGTALASSVSIDGAGSAVGISDSTPESLRFSSGANYFSYSISDNVTGVSELSSGTIRVSPDIFSSTTNSTTESFVGLGLSSSMSSFGLDDFYSGLGDGIFVSISLTPHLNFSGQTLTGDVTLQGTEQVTGFGEINGNISGSGSITSSGGTLSLGDSSKTDGINFSGSINVNSTTEVVLNDFDEALLSGTTTVQDGGILTADNGLVNTGSGLLQGVGTLNANVTNSAVLSSGISGIGMLTVDGDLQQTIDGTLTIELGGLLIGTEYDVLDVMGTATLGGTLDVDWFDLGGGLFDASLGDSFDILSAEAFVGEFDLLSLAVLGEGLNWKMDYLFDEIGTTDIARLTVVSSVPVPAAVWLFGSGLIGLIGVARRKKA